MPTFSRPRLFLVDTPATRAIDLGCSYTLTVDVTGDSQLHVTTGKVALVRKDGGEEVVPAGAVCASRRGSGRERLSSRTHRNCCAML